MASRRRTALPASRRTRVACGVACIALVAAPSPARASDDPVLGPAPGLPIYGATTTSAGSLYRDYSEELGAKLARTPDARYVTPLHDARPPRSSEQRARLGGPTGVHTFLGVHLRRSMEVQQVLGGAESTDLLTPFPGVLVASRLGVDLGWLSLYGITAAGGYRIMMFDFGADARALTPVTPSTIWSGVVLGGVGAEVTIGRRVSIGVEATSMVLTARCVAGELLAPDPTRSIQLGVGAIRIAY